MKARKQLAAEAPFLAFPILSPGSPQKPRSPGFGRLDLMLTLLLIASIAFVAIHLFNIQLAAGDVYPEYSSLRSDPLGAKLLFDSLALIPDIQVERNFLPPEYLPGGDAAILFLAMPLDRLADSRTLLESAASRGNRVVLTFQLPAGPTASDAKALYQDWHVKIDSDADRKHVHRCSFVSFDGWRAIDRAGPKTLAIEKDFGKGTIALFVESDDFNNQSSVAGDRFGLVSRAIGSNRHIVFDEQHFGIEQGGSIMQMARRFRLTGLVLGLLLIAALALWRNASGFPPVSSTGAAGLLTGRTSQAGLLTLLRRHVAPRDLTEVCWQEWLNGNRGQISRARLERAAEIVRTHGARPLDAAREITALLHAKGEL